MSSILNSPGLHENVIYPLPSSSKHSLQQGAVDGSDVSPSHKDRQAVAALALPGDSLPIRMATFTRSKYAAKPDKRRGLAKVWDLVVRSFQRSRESSKNHALRATEPRNTGPQYPRAGQLINKNAKERYRARPGEQLVLVERSVQEALKKDTPPGVDAHIRYYILDNDQKAYETLDSIPANTTVDYANNYGLIMSRGPGLPDYSNLKYLSARPQPTAQLSSTA